MPKGYIIGHFTVHDADRYRDYVAADTPILVARGAQFLVRGGQGEVVEGEAGSRHVVMAFPSYDAALATYRDPEYQKAADIRRSAADSVIVVAEGNDEDLPEPDGQAEGKLGYLIAHVSVADPEGYRPYVEGNTPVMRGHGARYIVRGGRSEVVEGVIVEENSVISMGVYIGQSTPIYDRATGEVSYGRVPAGSVVISGNLPKDGGRYSLYAAIIVKRVDAQTRAKTSLNDLLRD